MLLRIVTLSLLLSSPAHAANYFQKALYVAFQKTGADMRNCTLNFLKLKEDTLVVELIRKVPPPRRYNAPVWLSFPANASLRTQKTTYAGQEAVIYRSDISYRRAGQGNQYKWSREVNSVVVSQQTGKVLEVTLKVWFKSGFFGEVDSWDLTCYGY